MQIRPAMGVAVLAAALSVLQGCERQEGHPNVILVIIDDLGWRDLGAYGSDFYETPNIDRIASEGTVFTQFYAASPVCSPTRASLLTGKHPARLHITNWIGGERNGPLLQAQYERQLPLEEFTIGEAFEAEGYATGYIGKWHLGAGEFMPTAQGFDTTIGVNDAGHPAAYFFPYRRDTPSVWDIPDLEDGEEGEYLTDRLTDEALGFIGDHQHEPFFLVLSHYAVHTPIRAREESAEYYRRKASGLSVLEGLQSEPEGDRAFTKSRQDDAVYAAMVESVDESIGAIMARLSELELFENTVVVFTSDNGGLSTLENRPTGAPTANVPLRAGKGWLYEGGIRMPLIVWRPGATAAGGSGESQAWPSLVDRPAISMDLYPTLLGLADLDMIPNQHLDGVNLTQLFGEHAEYVASQLYWHFPHYHGSGNVPSSAVRVGDWKLIEWLETGLVELYDLAADVSESTDRAQEMPEKAEELRQVLEDWRGQVGAVLPQPNPDWE